MANTISMGFDKNSLTIIDSVDSTNNYAMRLIKAGLAEAGSAFFAMEQTHGKGRQNKDWITEKGQNILLSIVIVPAFLKLARQFDLSVAVSLACVDFLKKYTEDIAVKWPNDIFWNDRKAGGILIENVIQGSDWKWSVIGIGININQTKFTMKNNFLPVSLKQITGKDFDIITLAKELKKSVMKRYEALENSFTFKAILAEYNEHLFGFNKKVKLKKDNAVFETTIIGVSLKGRLITADTIEREFNFNEVEWLNNPA